MQGGIWPFPGETEEYTKKLGSATTRDAKRISAARFSLLFSLMCLAQWLLKKHSAWQSLSEHQEISARQKGILGQVPIHPRTISFSVESPQLHLICYIYKTYLSTLETNIFLTTSTHYSALQVQNNKKTELTLSSVDAEPGIWRADRQELEHPRTVVSKGGPGTNPPQMPRDSAVLYSKM